VKKKDLFSQKNKKDWDDFTRKLEHVTDKEDSFSNQKNINRVKKLDLHGCSLEEANREVKKFIINSYRNGINKLIIITGKGKRSKIYDDPYVSETMGVLKNSVPDFIMKDFDLKNIVTGLSKAKIRDGGDGAIYVNLKKIII